MTALPIIETDQGEIASYIPTNLISITDGLIYLDRKLFVGGFLPAIDVTRSVSRIGGKAQDPRIKEEVGRMKLDYLQYLELEVFTRFSAKLEASAQKMISRGRLLRELLKQDRLSPLSIEEQLAWLVAFNDNRLDSLSAGKRAQCSDKISHYLATGALTLEAGRETWSESIGGLFSTAEDAAT